MLSAISLLLMSASGMTADGWRLTRDGGYCGATREISAAADTVDAVAIAQDVIFNTVKVELSTPEKGPGWQTKGVPTYETAKGPVELSDRFFTVKQAPHDRYQINLMLSSSWSGSALVSDLGVKTNHGREKISQEGLDAGVQLVAECRLAYLKDLGIDPAEVDPTLTPAKAADGVWFSDADVAKLHLNSGLYRPFLIWRIAADGQTSRCLIVASSGAPALDDMICPLFLKRARYLKPAFTQDGRPSASWQGRRIQFRL